MIIDVISGTVASVLEDTGSNPSAHSLSTPLPIDSDDVIALALSTIPDLAPAGDESRAKGYHYFLEPRDSGQLVFTVLGSLNGQTARVDVDATSGQVVSSQIRSYAGSGSVLYSADGGLSWHVSTLIGTPIVAVGTNPSDNSIVYSVAVSANGLTFHSSVDFGMTWSEVSHLPAGAGQWVYDIVQLVGPPSRIVISTDRGIWHSIDGGQSWAEVTEPPSANPFMMRRLVNSEGEWLSVSFAGGTFVTTDVMDWTLRLPGSHFLSTSSDETQLAAIDQLADPEGAFVITATGQISLTVPLGTLRLAGTLFPPTPHLTFAQDPGHVYEVLSYDAGNATWAPTLSNVTLLALSTSRDFPEHGGLVLAGGHGIYRKTVTIPTWVHVLPDPSDPQAVQAPPGTSRAVLGTGEIVAICFLDDNHAIAVNSGEERWQ